MQICSIFEGTAVELASRFIHDLGITGPTVYLYSGNLRCKIGACTMLQAVAIAAKTGIF